MLVEEISICACGCGAVESMSSENVLSVIQQFLESYRSRTPTKLKLVDAYLTYILLTGVVQFAYCCLVGTFPFNSFLSGFISCVGSFVLGGDYATTTLPILHHKGLRMKA